MEFALHYAWLIPALPLLSAVLIAAFMKQLKEPKAGYVGAGFMFVALVLSTGILLGAMTGAFGHGGAAEHDAVPYGTAGATPLAQWSLAPWAEIGGNAVAMGLMVDHLTAVMLFVVTLVSFCVQLYSISYLHGEKRFPKYFAAINLFTTGMLLAVMADNLFLLVVGWELMGLCSYMLIGHWYENQAPQEASMKAFMTTRVGDVFMLVGIGYLWYLTGTLNLAEIAARLPEINPWALGAAAVLMFGGPIGKSAQFPLHTWLPDAMAGPTPGSALIHAATMVAVGVYFVARTFTIFATAPAEVLGIVALVGAFTSIFAASIATVRTDIKQVLAYSTVSQLGYMVMALGTGSFSAGTFHLTTHAFFKALLFLCSGSVIHAVHTQEMHQMGGLRKKMPITYITWMIGYLALAGFPLFSGFFSKDELLLAAYNWHAPHGWPEWISMVPFVLGVGTAFLTAYYMTRATYLTFFGKPRDQHAYDHAHESGPLMTIPLIILAVLAFGAGYAWTAALEAFGIHLPTAHWWPHFAGHPLQSEAHGGAAFVTTVATAAGLIGIGLGLALYKFAPVSLRVSLIRSFQPLYVVLKNKYYVDEFYHATFIKGTLALGRFLSEFDRRVVDGIVNAVGWIGARLGDVSAWFDFTWIDGIVRSMGDLAVFSGRQARRLATGQVQAYMMTTVVVVVFGAVAAYLIFGGMGG